MILGDAEGGPIACARNDYDNNDHDFYDALAIESEAQRSMSPFAAAYFAEYARLIQAAEDAKLKHIGLHTDRLSHTGGSVERENAFAAQWILENERHDVLRSLMLIGASNPLDPWDRGRTLAHTIEQRDAQIVATVMQWLGTNVGIDYVRQSLARAGYKIVDGRGVTL